MDTPSDPIASRPNDDRLGLHQPITRRDFVNGALVAGAGLLLSGRVAGATSPADDWNGYGGVGQYRHSNGNTYDVMNAAHGIRRTGRRPSSWCRSRGATSTRCTTSKDYGFYFGSQFGQRPGVWVLDPWGRQLDGAPLSEGVKADLMRWRTVPDDGPRPQVEGDAISRQLDTITLEEHLMARHRISRETVRTFLSPVEGGWYGPGPDALSAYCAYAIETEFPGDGNAELGDQMFPDGNAGFVRLMVKTLIPEAFAGERSVEQVWRTPIRMEALDRAGAPTRIRLSATPSRGLRAVLSLARADGQRRRAQLAHSAQDGDGRLPLVRGARQLSPRAPHVDHGKRRPRHRPRRADRADHQGALFAARAPDRRAGEAGARSCSGRRSRSTSAPSARRWATCLRLAGSIRGATSPASS